MNDTKTQSIACPNCENKLDLDASCIGIKLKCPFCARYLSAELTQTNKLYLNLIAINSKTVISEPSRNRLAKNDPSPVDRVPENPSPREEFAPRQSSSDYLQKILDGKLILISLVIGLLGSLFPFYHGNSLYILSAGLSIIYPYLSFVLFLVALIVFLIRGKDAKSIMVTLIMSIIVSCFAINTIVSIYNYNSELRKVGVGVKGFHDLADKSLESLPSSYQSDQEYAEVKETLKWTRELGDDAITIATKIIGVNYGLGLYMVSCSCIFTFIVLFIDKFMPMKMLPKVASR